MDQILDVVVKTRSTRAQNDDDFADRLSSRYTVIQLVAFAILVGITQYVRTPMTCWAPVHFTGSHIQFTNNYCWVKNTYYLPWAEQHVPREWDSEGRQMIPYYQWIPFILLAQAIMFYLPYIVWHGFNSKAGIDADSIVVAAQKVSTDNTTTDERLTIVVNQIHRFLNTRRKAANCRCVCTRECLKTRSKACGRRTGSFLLVIFLLSKICYIGNVIGQLFLLNTILKARYSTFGVDILHNMAEHVDWTEDSYVAFPRVTLCDFKIRGQDMANVHPYTVQCVLPVNLYNEKIYMFLWFWMIFVAVVSIFSFLTWCCRTLVTRDQMDFVQTHVFDRLEEHCSDNTKRRAVLNRFVQNYLLGDGVLLLRLIAHNTNGITTTEIAGCLFDRWVEYEVSSKAIEEEVSGESSSLTSRKEPQVTND